MPELSSKKRIVSYQEFWPFYLEQHSQRKTKIIHVVGTSLGIVVGIGFAIIGRPLFMPTGFLLAYAPAWYSHFFIEKNRPATFQYPIWSLISDFRMVYLVFTGKLK